MNKEKWEIRVCECEHEGDLDHYADVLCECGAEIIEQYLDPYEYEEGVITVAVPEDKSFKEAFGRKISESEIGGFIESRIFIAKLKKER